MASRAIGIALSSAALLMAVNAATTFAQYGTPPSGAGPSPMQELARQAAIDKIEAVENEVEQNPSLLNDPRYLSAHPHLAKFVSEHPEASQLIQQNPRAFFNAFNAKHGLGAPQAAPY